jgi:hypothetical protein
MKSLKEFNKQANHNILVEEIEQNNNSGYLAEDIASIIEAHQEDKWQVFESADAFSNHLKERRKKKQGVIHD